jgi:uncharacterized membrane protein
MYQPFVAAFSGTSVEFFETAVIAYAVTRAGYPREAFAGIVLGHVAVLLLTIAILPFSQYLPLAMLRVIAAVLLTSTGLYWSQKSLRRLLANRRPSWIDDPLGKFRVRPTSAIGNRFSPWVCLVMSKSSAIEAAEIMIVVLPIGIAQSAWHQVIGGVITGVVLVSIVVLVAHRQLKNVPEVEVKLMAGLILLTIGLVWLAEIGTST